jgi:hypothetical protein
MKTITGTQNAAGTGLASLHSEICLCIDMQRWFLNLILLDDSALAVITKWN